MRGFLWRICKWFLFRLDAERAHRLSFLGVHLGMRFGPWSLRIVSGAPTFKSIHPVPSDTVWGLSFASPIGLAAGFDKDAEILPALPHLGFGFAEIGTVTPLPQAGNEQPRLFRVPEKQALFNRMGFNGLGAAVVSARLEEIRRRESLPEAFRVGVNLGKNKDTPAEEAASDYVRAALPFRELSDYLVINVSSPNTPGLRDLQTETALKPIIQELKHLISGWKVVPPLLLKLAPELENDFLAELMPRAEIWGIDGWVLTNTGAGEYVQARKKLSGGWSGAPLRIISRSRLQAARVLTQLPIISVGGIVDETEAKKRMELGANLIQIYSGWIFRGPGFPVRITKALKRKANT